jgi:hypothetical protein
MKTLDDAVIELNGVFDGSLPKYNPDYDFWVTTTMDGKATLHAVAAGFSVTKEQFQQRAKELGFVNGYRWGVEYTTNGKKPELDGDIVVKYKTLRNGSNEAIVDSLAWSIHDIWAHKIESFKITDQRYKPADTGYLISEIPESKPEAENVSDWFDYDTLEMKDFPKAGTMVIGLTEPVLSVFQCVFVGFDGDGSIVIEAESGSLCRYRKSNLKFRPFGWNRKAEAEKKRVVDAVWEAYHELGDLSVRATFDAMYDAGYLRMPPEKN